MAPDHAAILVQQRMVDVRLVLHGTVDLRAYPHRYLALVSPGLTADAMPRILACVEFLDQFGWQMITMTEVGNSGMLCAVVRRGTHGPPGGASSPR